MPESEFMDRYAVISDGEGTYAFDQIPCPFLSENRCSCYAARPAACRAFPNSELLSIWDRIERVCPQFGNDQLQ